MAAVTLQGEIHGLRQHAGRVAQVADGEGDHAEAEVGEEREGDISRYSDLNLH